MACYHPNKGFVVGLLPNGKKHVVFTSATVQYLVSADASFSHFTKSCENLPEDIRSNLVKFNDFIYMDSTRLRYPLYYCLDSMHLPCGQCTGCRIDKSREWANRMVMEASYHPTNCFLTLTYDDEHVPISNYESYDQDGEFDSDNPVYTLYKKDLQNFFKRLRKEISVIDPISGKVTEESKIRYYACGEYGTSTLRPHYHVIVFNWFPPDAKLYNHDPRGYDFYTSEILSRVWPYGFHLVTFVTWETCAYCARYVTKKITGKYSGFYEQFGIEPEFSLMSRKPGIARLYFEDHKDDIYRLDKSSIIRFSSPDGGLTFKPPRYFDSLFDLENPELMSGIRDNRIKIAENKLALKLLKTNLNFYELLEVEEREFKNRVKSLKRDL